MVALVIGGSGFLGRHLVAHLLANKCSVKVYGRREADLPSAVEYIYGDLFDRARLREAMQGVDCVFHFAWTTVPQTSNEDPQGDVQSNVVAGIGLLDACCDAKIRTLIFPSSGGTVYAPSKCESLDETSATEPICSYGITKLTMEKYLALYHYLHGLDYRVLRVSNAYGEGQPTDRPQGLIGVSMKRAALNEPITIWGDGTVVRDYIYAGDIAECCVKAALTPLPADAPRVFNVSSHQGHSIKEIMSTLESVTGRQLDLTYTPARRFDIDKVILSNKRAREVLDWSPRTSLDEGFARTWKHVMERSGR